MQPSPLPPVANPAPQRKTAGFAIASLVLGILSLCCGGAFITGIPAIILGIIALVRINKTPSLGGQGLAITGLITGGIATVFITPLLLGMMLPAVTAVREQARRAACANNVKMLCMASIAFAQEHDGALPKTLDELKPRLGGEKTAGHVLVCPAAKDQSAPSYRLEHAGEKVNDLPAAPTSSGAPDREPSQEKNEPHIQVRHPQHRELPVRHRCHRRCGCAREGLSHHARAIHGGACAGQFLDAAHGDQPRCHGLV
jgi:hypothetical protein